MTKPAFFYNDENGNPQDASLHEELLNNPEFDDLTAREEILSATEKGMPIKDAVMLLGTDAIREQYVRTGSIEKPDTEESDTEEL